MADAKISALTPASALAGTEVLPIVQSGSTKKVATDDLTVKNVRSNTTTGLLQITGPGAGTTRTMTVPNGNFTAARTDAAQSFTGDQTLSTGNLVIGTAGKGIDFSAASHAAGMTSELLNDYEEGIFTPGMTSASGTVTVDDASGRGQYVKVGKIVYFTVSIGISTDASVGTSDLTLTGLPFASQAGYDLAEYTYSNFSGGDFGTGGANGAAYVNGTSLYHIVRTINISSRGTFYWGYAGAYRTT